MQWFPFYADRGQCKKKKSHVRGHEEKWHFTSRHCRQSLIYEIYVCWHIAGRIYENIPATNHMVLYWMYVFFFFCLFFLLLFPQKGICSNVIWSFWVGSLESIFSVALCSVWSRHFIPGCSWTTDFFSFLFLLSLTVSPTGLFTV